MFVVKVVVFIVIAFYLNLFFLLFLFGTLAAAVPSDTCLVCVSAGEDERPQPEQRGWGLLHSGRRTRFGHAGGLD